MVYIRIIITLIIIFILAGNYVNVSKLSVKKNKSNNFKLAFNPGQSLNFRA